MSCRIRALVAPLAIVIISSGVAAQPVVVTNNLDGAPAPNGSLRWAVSTALSGDTITFNLAAVDSLITLTEGEIVIDKDLAIDGSGSPGVITVSADSMSRLFRIDSAEVKFEFVDLVEGAVPGGDGGCILQDGGLLRLNDVNLRRCSALRGGALFADSATVFMRRSDSPAKPEISSNSARHGGGAYTNQSRLDAANVNFLNNVADSLGGALYAVGDDIDLDRLEVSGNSAYSGGGVYLVDPLFQSEEADYARNTADFRGGSIYQTDGSSVFNETDIEDSRADFGGGIYVSGGMMQFSFSAVARDTAAFDGGGMLATGSTDVLVGNSTFDRNYAEQGGGGIYVVNSKLDLNGATASKNRASTGGGLYGASGATLLVRDGSEVTQNRADLGMAGLDGGGGIFVHSNADSLWMRHSTVSLNYAKAGRGGGIFNNSYANIFGSSDVIANEADGDGGIGGGGVYNQGTMIITDTRIAGNMTDSTIADSRGGGISNAGHLTVNSSTVNSNLAKGEGGGIANFDTLIVSNSTISANVSKDEDGGGIRNQGVLSIQNSTITLNEAEGLGGGVFDVFISTGPVTLYSSIVASNTATGFPDFRIIGADSVTSQGYNLIGDSTGTMGMMDGVNNDQVGTPATPLSPGLAGLDLNGGETRTHALLPGSPAIDKGDCSISGITSDQRGEPRPIDDPSVVDAGDGCDVGSFELDAAGAVAVDLNMWLEGAYQPAGDQMSTDLNPVIPLSQPYSDAAFTGTPLDYDGLEMLPGVPGNAVDWVLVQLRTGDPANPPMTVASTRAALVLNDGSVVDLDGVSNLTFPGATAGFYYVAAFGRNHLGVMSADSLALSPAPASLDFTVSDTAAFGNNPMAEMETDVFGLWSSDANVDGQVTAGDFNLWLADTKAVATGYLLTDFNLDGQVTVIDFNLWLRNTKAVVTSQVP